ncbi:hypothetical protein ACFQX4_02880 [Roseomonas sp. GCM10028921]
MYGLPGQTVAHVEASARFVSWLGADRAPVFGYAHVDWMKPHQKAINAAALPGVEERMEQAEAAGAVLAAAGFVALGLDHFARPEGPLARAASAGQLRRNFHGCTTDDAPALIGLGYRHPAGRPRAEPAGRAGLCGGRGRGPAARGARRGAHGEGSLAQPGDRAVDVRLRRRRRPHPPGALPAALERMEPLAEQGVVRVGDGRVEVTSVGRRFVRQVAACFDAYLASAALRHSSAV